MESQSLFVFVPLSQVRDERVGGTAWAKRRGTIPHETGLSYFFPQTAIHPREYGDHGGESWALIRTNLSVVHPKKTLWLDIVSESESFASGEVGNKACPVASRGSSHHLLGVINGCTTLTPAHDDTAAAPHTNEAPATFKMWRLQTGRMDRAFNTTWEKSHGDSTDQCHWKAAKHLVQTR